MIKIDPVSLNYFFPSQALEQFGESDFGRLLQGVSNDFR
jgi:hypothetical protein